jgi:RimJ/RimL family protein N-acetyltransferase
MVIDLRNIDLKNAGKIAEWKSDPILSKKILSIYKETSIEEAEDWIKKNSADKNQVLLGIYLLENDHYVLIGVARLMFIDFMNKNSELGIYIGDQNYYGFGYGETSLKLLLSLAFENLNLNKVFLKVSAENKNAIKLYEKVGFVTEGTLKSHHFCDEKYIDLKIMSIFNNKIN